METITTLEQLKQEPRQYGPQRVMRTIVANAETGDFGLIAQYIREQPEEFPDSGGSMATDEIPGYRDRLWAGFAEAALERGQIEWVIRALGEMGDYASEHRLKEPLVQSIADRVPYA